MDWTIAQIREAENQELGKSDWIHIDQARINSFADTTEDHQWIHTDPEKARESDFGSTIAHGFLVAALIPRMFKEIFHLVDAEMLINYGVEKIRFISPVPVDSDICLSAKLIKSTERRGRLMLRIRGEVLLRATGRRAMVAEVLFLAVPLAEASTS